MPSLFNDIRQHGKITIGYISAFGLLLISFLLTMYAHKQLIKKTAVVERSNIVMSNLSSLLSFTKDAELAYQTLLVTGDSTAATRFTASQLAVDSIYKATLQLLQQAPPEEQHLNAIKEKADLKHELMERDLASKANGKNLEMISVALNRQPVLLKQLHNDIVTMQLHGKQLLQERQDALRETSVAVTTIIIASIIISFFLVGFAFTAHVKETSQRVAAQEKVRSYQAQLNNRIQELDEANSRLVEMKSQEKFAAAGRIALLIAHEIRNPLTNVNLANEQLATDLEADENAGYLCKVIHRNSQRINQLITELLNSTKFTDLDVEKIALNGLIEEAVTEAREKLCWKNVKLVRKFVPGCCDVMVDKNKMKRALVNIFSSAIEARHDQVPVELVIETKIINAQKCIVQITDRGRKMDEEELSTIFEPNFTNKPNGNGLALTNTQNIILNHKGTIAVRSLKDVGTNFTITLKIAPENN